MGYRRGLSALALLTMLATPVALGQETPAPADSNDAFFRRALARMNALPPPPSFTYAADVRVNGGTIDMRRVGPEDVHALIFAGGVPGADGAVDSTFTFSFDSHNRLTYLVGGASMLGPFPGPIFDPTWNSAFRWMQSRRFFDTDAASATPSPAPSPTRLKTIAVVSRAPELSYHVIRTARTTCANSDPGWELTVVPVGDPESHPLTGVTVDADTGLFCAMHFEETMTSEPSGHTRGAIDVQFARANGLYVVTAESISMRLGVPGTFRNVSAAILFRQFQV